MKKVHIPKVRIHSTARTCNNGHVHVRTTISGGGKTKTISKTYR